MITLPSTLDIYATAPSACASAQAKAW